MKIKKLLFLLLIIIYHIPVIGISIVYNMRITTITRRQKFENNQIEQFHNLLSATPFAQWRKIRDANFKQNAHGIIGSYIYNKDNHYLKIDSAIGRVNSTITGDTNDLKISRTQTDDILFTGGFGQKIGNHIQLAYSGLFGIPTHRNYILEFSQFGIGHIGLGGQIDCAYNYSANEKHTLFGAIRFIHFLKRSVDVKNPSLIPLYSHTSYNLKPGNVADLFISHQNSWNKHNRFEFGYDATFGFGANICPTNLNFSGTATLIRNSFFGAYSRFISIHKIPSGIIVAFSGGFDSKPKLLGNKYFFTLWGLWGFAF